MNWIYFHVMPAWYWNWKMVNFGIGNRDWKHNPNIDRLHMFMRTFACVYVCVNVCSHRLSIHLIFIPQMTVSGTAPTLNIPLFGWRAGQTANNIWIWIWHFLLSLHSYSLSHDSRRAVFFFVVSQRLCICYSLHACRFLPFSAIVSFYDGYLYCAYDTLVCAKIFVWLWVHLNAGIWAETTCSVAPTITMPAIVARTVMTYEWSYPSLLSVWICTNDKLDHEWVACGRQARIIGSQLTFDACLHILFRHWLNVNWRTCAAMSRVHQIILSKSRQLPRLQPCRVICTHAHASIYSLHNE